MYVCSGNYLITCTFSCFRRWQEGLLSQLLSKSKGEGRCTNMSNGGHGGEWVVLDGPLSPFQLETLLTLLDSNKLIKLTNGRGIPIDSNYRFILEVRQTIYIVLSLPFYHLSYIISASITGLSHSTWLILSPLSLSLFFHCDLVGLS